MSDYTHFSPFRFNTVEQTAEPTKQVKKEKAQSIQIAAERKRRTHDMGSTMSVEMAHGASSTPTAYISPNPPDVCRMAKSVFGF
jgi:hypothetical protein